MTHLKTFFFYISSFLLPVLLVPNFSSANKYSQPGFYTPDHIVLDNGLGVVLKQRGDARNVSIRVVVGVGHDDFLKGKKTRRTCLNICLSREHQSTRK